MKLNKGKMTNPNDHPLLFKRKHPVIVNAARGIIFLALPILGAVGAWLMMVIILA